MRSEPNALRRRTIDISSAGERRRSVCSASSRVPGKPSTGALFFRRRHRKSAESHPSPSSAHTPQGCRKSSRVENGEPQAPPIPFDMKQTTFKTDAPEPENSIRRKKRTGSEQRQSPPQSSRSTQEQLAAKKIRTAWIRLGTTMQQFCRLPSRRCTLCLVSEDRIVFRPLGDPRHTELKLSRNIIVRECNGVRDYFEIVLIKGHGIAYEVSGQRISATMLSLKFLKELHYDRGLEKPRKISQELTAPVPHVEPPKRGPQHVFLTEEILRVLAEAAMRPVHQVLTEEGIRRTTYERWRETFSGLRIDQVQHVLNLENENARLAAIVRTLRLDKKMLQEELYEKTRSSAANKREPRAERSSEEGMTGEDGLLLGFKAHLNDIPSTKGQPISAIK